MASFCGESMTKNKCKHKLVKKLSIPARTMSKGHQIRTRVPKSQSLCFKYTQRKTRKACIIEGMKKIFLRFLVSSRYFTSIGNKKDVIVLSLIQVTRSIFCKKKSKLNPLLISRKSTWILIFPGEHLKVVNPTSSVKPGQRTA